MRLSFPSTIFEDPRAIRLLHHCVRLQKLRQIRLRRQGLEQKLMKSCLIPTGPSSPGCRSTRIPHSVAPFVCCYDTLYLAPLSEFVTHFSCEFSKMLKEARVLQAQLFLPCFQGNSPFPASLHERIGYTTVSATIEWHAVPTSCTLNL